MKIEEMESKTGQIFQPISWLITRLNNDKKLASPDFNELLLRGE